MNNDHVTGFALAREVNAELEELELRPIPPQMVYNYMRNRLIPSVERNGAKLIERAAADAWKAKYVARRVERKDAGVRG